MAIIINKVRSILGFFLLLSCYLLQFCSAIDTTTGKSIRDGQTLISPQEHFALGFFSPGNSKNRYVGIWYNNIPVHTVVWVANRENPVTDSSGILKIGKDGNLVVLDGRNNTLWSTINASPHVHNPTAKLLDSGNLVLMQGDDHYNNTGNTLWQSFDHPCDTVIPGMRIGFNLNSGLNLSYTSWKNPDDPSFGDSSVGVDPYGSLQTYVWKNGNKYWRSGYWDGQIFTGVPEMTTVYGNGFDLVGDTFFKYSSTRNLYTRFLLNSKGIIELSAWDNDSKKWGIIWSQSADDCQVYGLCGPKGQCNRNGSQICECLPGFESRTDQGWAMKNWSGGCFRRTPLQCQMNGSSDGDGFWRLEGLKLPDDSALLSEVSDLEVCQDKCVRNCSCVASAFVNGIGCMVWGKNLMDIEKFHHGGQDLYIRLAGSELEKLKSNVRGRRQLLLIKLGACILGANLLVLCTYCLRRWRLIQRDMRTATEATN